MSVENVTIRDIESPESPQIVEDRWDMVYS